MVVEVGDARAAPRRGPVAVLSHAPESTTARVAAWDDRRVLRTIVEGEPGIFPDPVARIMRGIGGIFRRRGPAAEPPAADAQTGGDEPTTGDEPDQPGGHSGEAR